MENNYIVYKHTSPSNKVYIGITQQTLKARWKKGKGYKHNKYFTNAIQKYGEENFKHEILYSNLTLDEAKKIEIRTIALYDSTNRRKGYNITLGGEGGNKGITIEQKREKKRIEAQIYKLRHPDKVKLKDREYKEKHREEIHKKQNEYTKREDVRKHRTEYMRKYRELNREKIRKINSKSYFKNKDKISKYKKAKRLNNDN